MSSGSAVLRRSWLAAERCDVGVERQLSHFFFRAGVPDHDQPHHGSAEGDKRRRPRDRIDARERCLSFGDSDLRYVFAELKTSRELLDVARGQGMGASWKVHIGK